jgi:hypothetical protein
MARQTTESAARFGQIEPILRCRSMSLKNFTHRAFIGHLEVGRFRPNSPGSQDRYLKLDLPDDLVDTLGAFQTGRSGTDHGCEPREAPHLYEGAL